MPASMSLRAIALAAMAFLAEAGPAGAQDNAAGHPLIFATKAQIATAAAEAKAAIQPGHGSSSRPIAVLGDYSAKVEYHVGPNIANAHPHQAELFEAIEGSGALITGGTIVGSGQGSSITGGTVHRIAAGDMFIVPENTPHWFSRVDGHMVLVSVMLPRPTSGAELPPASSAAEK